MAPAASIAQATNKVKRPMSIQTNGINSSTSSPSPSMSAGRLPSGSKNSQNSAATNGAGNSSGARSANRNRSGHTLGRGMKNNSAGIRSGSVAEEFVIQQVAQSQPYVKTEHYILHKYRKSPPSLIIHLYATHFRFDQQQNSFSYTSPMRVLLDHLRQKTIPHELVDYFILNEVAFYEGCMIVQILDHKSVAPQQPSSQPKEGSKEGVSIHTLSSYITPSPYASYPRPDLDRSRSSKEQSNDGSTKSRTSAQQDKENMPAPGTSNDSQKNKTVPAPAKLKVTTCVLFPTPVSTYVEIARNSTAPHTPDVDKRQERSEGSTSATLAQPPTPLGAVPPTPGLNMPPAAKRLKLAKSEFNCGNIYAAEAQIILATTAPLALEPANSATECSRLLESLAHPMHLEKPPQPKSRKRTVAEMAADEALAADEQRYMLILDEQRFATVARGAGGINVADGAGQAGGGFEARFEKFNALTNIRKDIEDKKALKKAAEAEAQRKSKAEEEIQRKQEIAEARQKEIERRQNLAARQQAAQQQEAQRRAIAQQQQQQQHSQGLQGMPPQTQGPHAHPSQPNGIVSNGMQAQRFHPHQGTQAQMSSPIVRNGTPHSQASPTVNNGIGNNPMQHSTSSMGGSPPRPGSVVHQNHPAPIAAHGMVAQRSQQSHAGTPRMHNATPNMQSTPLNRGLTPRMSQGSPLQGVMAQAPGMGQIGMNSAQMHVQGINSMSPVETQQYLMALRAQQQQQMQAQSMRVMPNGQQLTPHQIMQHQQMRQMQMQANANNPNHQLAQNYQNQLAAMRQAGMPQNMNMNQQFMGNNMNMQNMQGMALQQQMQQQQQQQQLQMQQQQQQQHPQQQQQMNPQIAMAQQYMHANPMQTHQQMAAVYKQLYNREMASGAHPQGLPDLLKKKLQMQAQNIVLQNFKAKMQAGGQQGFPPGMQMQNGMGMARQPGM
ncbi:uncharacterized protein EAE97_000341 [Botrytis byssoidea]|uniref:Spt20-like SEP domain-containing protein n=1 Tax=Botrytis byssoidea TaxID=139641 RepID=A0A9P5IV65_9HELO|nr:uncharacterized protein EAE97_000341 [Botrytis byssoidea]KAF7955082.1 hypothetical protein EAE97_000341 [Botrytis byssoidea]